MSQKETDKLNKLIPSSVSCPAGISTSMNTLNVSDCTWGYGSPAEQTFLYGITKTSTLDPVYNCYSNHNDSYPKSAQYDWNTQSNASFTPSSEYNCQKQNINLNETLFSTTDYHRRDESKSSSSCFWGSSSDYALGKSGYDYGAVDSFNWGIGKSTEQDKSNASE